MRKFVFLLFTSLLIFSTSSLAQEPPPYKSWVGGFVQYYDADSDKPLPAGGLDDGKGFGAEFGFRFDPKWAVRFELGRLILDNDVNVNPASLADDGTQIGVDAMYFLDKDAAYFFTGIREQVLSDSYRMASLGVGKHWVLNEDWRLITEVATFYDFGQDFNEYSAKLGVAYIFGNKQSKPTAPLDSDNDGVIDANDRCPNTPPGTQVNAAGCNNDLDGDGVINELDQCPGTPRGVVVDTTGCQPKDSDGDGVIDANDQCPNTPRGASVNELGCEINDADGDGIVDSIDECPDTPSEDKVNAAGCSILVERSVSINLDILFPNNSAVISNPDSQDIVDFVEFLRRYGSTNIEIQGHSSAVGAAEYNQKLSERRANAVKALLVSEYGIDESRLTAVGYGESRLKFTENTAEAHRLNRRIEAQVTAQYSENERR